MIVIYKRVADLTGIARLSDVQYRVAEYSAERKSR